MARERCDEHFIAIVFQIFNSEQGDIFCNKTKNNRRSCAFCIVNNEKGVQFFVLQFNLIHFQQQQLNKGNSNTTTTNDHKHKQKISTNFVPRSVLETKTTTTTTNTKAVIVVVIDRKKEMKNSDICNVFSFMLCLVWVDVTRQIINSTSHCF